MLEFYFTYFHYDKHRHHKPREWLSNSGWQKEKDFEFTSSPKPSKPPTSYKNRAPLIANGNDPKYNSQIGIMRYHEAISPKTQCLQNQAGPKRLDFYRGYYQRFCHPIEIFCNKSLGKTLGCHHLEADFLSWQKSLAYSLRTFLDNFSLLLPLQRVLAAWFKIFNKFSFRIE